VRFAAVSGRIGEHFHARGDGCWYEMTTVFFRVELVSEPDALAEQELSGWMRSERRMPFSTPATLGRRRGIVSSDGPCSI
jgi:hypothetical protein